MPRKYEKRALVSEAVAPAAEDVTNEVETASLENNQVS